MIRYFTFLLLLIGSACIQIGSDPQPTRYYLLEPVVAVAENLPVKSAQPLILALGPIDFPPYLDRPELVTYDQQRVISVAGQDRWAEPLSDNLTRTLKENLTRQFPDIIILSVPWETNGKDQLAAKLTINRFDGTLGQSTEVDIRWQLSAPPDRKLVRHGHFTAQLPIGNSRRDLVQGLNSALAQFSLTLGEAISANRPK